MEGDINPLVKPIYMKNSTLNVYNIFRSQLSFYAIFDDDVCNADDMKGTYCEYMNEVFVIL